MLVKGIKIVKIISCSSLSFIVIDKYLLPGEIQ